MRLWFWGLYFTSFNLSVITVDTCLTPVVPAAGSTQDEVGAIVRQSITEAKISGNDRPIAWDGERGGPGLRTQIQNVQNDRVIT